MPAVNNSIYKLLNFLTKIHRKIKKKNTVIYYHSYSIINAWASLFQFLHLYLSTENPGECENKKRLNVFTSLEVAIRQQSDLVFPLLIDRKFCMHFWYR